ncbi:hypothetical protein GCM10009801_80800 [Streptomyces albiaxialis]|uniref:Uncharacterized protein n=1 Tax=Streptomyces albiaxialis TaxID=329523 RepID=A0ABN2X6V7_9ACTN
MREKMTTRTLRGCGSLAPFRGSFWAAAPSPPSPVVPLVPFVLMPGTLPLLAARLVQYHDDSRALTSRASSKF